MVTEQRTSTPQDALAWEATWRGRAGAATLAAAVLTIGGSILTGIGLHTPDYDGRSVTVMRALRLTAQHQPIPPGTLSAATMVHGDRVSIAFAGVVAGLSFLALFLTLAFLFRAARARRPEMQQAVLVLAAVGAVIAAVGEASTLIAYYVGAHGFPSSADISNSAAADAITSGGLVAGQAAAALGRFALGFAFALIALNAMRVGLLSRFMGFLGIIVSVTFVLPLDQQGVLRSFWLLAAALLILGRWPTGQPKAWLSGEAEPWPSQQQLREQREAARRGEDPPPPRARREPPATPPPVRPPEPASAAPSPATSKKRKRKRRG